VIVERAGDLFTILWNASGVRNRAPPRRLLE
jgi:hypothetical protein